MFRSIMVVFALCVLVIPVNGARGQDGRAATRPVIRPAPVSTATRPAVGTRPAMNLNPRPPFVGTRPAPDELAFTLDGKKFTEGDIEKWLRKVLPSGPQAPGEDQITMMLQRARTQLINLIVDDEFLQAAARKNNALITPEDIDAGVEKRVQAVLKAQNITRQEFDERIRQSGSTLDQQISQLKTNYYQLLLPLQQEKLGRALFKDVQVSEQELKDYYADPRMAQRFAAQVRASHILIKPAATAPADMPAAREAARKKAEAVLAQAKAPGADFAALAQANSDDPGSKTKGGDLGFFPHARMVKPFADAAFALKPGEISDLVESQFGYHIIKMTGTQPAKELKDVEAELREELKERKIREAVTKYLAEARAAAKIEYPPGKEPPAPAPVRAPGMAPVASPGTRPAATQPAMRPITTVRPGTRPG